MRICFITHKVKKGDGQGRVNYEVIHEALREGHEILIIASELSEDLVHHPKVEWSKISVQGMPTELLRNQLFAFRTTIELFKHRAKLDLTIVNGFVTYAKSDINCIHFVHSAWFASKYHPYRERKSINALYQWIFTRLNRLLEQNAMKRTHAIVAVSGQVKQELIQHTGMAEDRIAVIQNGVDLQEFYPRSVARSELQLEEKTLYAMFAGDIRSSRKNLDTVLHALAAIPDIHLLVLGWTKGSIYPQMTVELGISDRVHFLGYRENMADWMSAADLFVYPSRYEPFALVLLEAMAVGLPVIASRNCGATELLTTEAAVIINDPDDVSALTEAIRQCASDRERLSQMGVQARNLALEHSWSEMSAKYVQLMEDLAVRRTLAEP